MSLMGTMACEGSFELNKVTWEFVGQKLSEFYAVLFNKNGNPMNSHNRVYIERLPYPHEINKSLNYSLRCNLKNC